MSLRNHVCKNLVLNPNPSQNPCRGAGEADLPGLTDEEKPRLRGPKRASKIRKLFNLSKDDDVRKYVNVFRKVRRCPGLGPKLPDSMVCWSLKGTRAVDTA